MDELVVAEPDRMADLVQFARLEVESGDLEPWAEMIKAVVTSQKLDSETALWLVYLYNEFDSFSSAWGVYRRWQFPYVWFQAPDRDEARQFPHMQERRNLHGGRGLKRMQSYCYLMNGKNQGDWLSSVMVEHSTDKHTVEERNFLKLMEHTQKVWGVGRLAAFEWTEFIGKVMGWPVHAPDAQLWLSSGPRKSLQKLYGNPEPTQKQLDAYANHCRNHLFGHNVPLQWEDFETVICDFNVMRGGRYYPGRHLAALRGEIEEVGEPDRSMLLDLFRQFVPAPWNEIGPGIDKNMMPRYMDTGVIHLPVEV